jgi:hypothetical protein
MNAFVYWFAFIIFFAAAAFLGYVLLFLGKNSMDANGKSIAEKTFFVLLALVLFSGFLIVKHRKKTVFYLFENGVQIGKNGNITPFENIADIFLFLTGRYIGNGYNNLAFRASEKGEWYIISPNYSGKIDVFLDKYFAPRVRFLEGKLQQGNAVTFHYRTKNKTVITTAKAHIKNQVFEIIRLGANALSIGNQNIDYANLLPLYMNGENFEIKTRDNNVIASFKYVDVLSFDVFREIYNHRTQKTV